MKLKSRKTGGIWKIDNDSIELDARNGKIYAYFKDEEQRRHVRELNEAMTEFELVHDRVETELAHGVYEVVAAILYASVKNAALKTDS